MLKRILTAAVLIPIVLALVWWGPPLLVAAAAAIVAAGALVEFFRLAERMGLRGFRKWTLACAVGLFYAQYSLGAAEIHSYRFGEALIRRSAGIDVSIEAVLLVFLFGAAAIGLFTKRPLQDVLPAIAVSSAGLVVIALPFSYLVRIDQVGSVGRQLVFLTLTLVWAGDVLAYFVGRFAGRLPMAPALSPKKTWEGAAANLLASLLVGAAFARWLDLEVVGMLVVAGLANIAGQMGDLIESAYKRGAAVKDSGGLLPGHGGVLDRIDSLIFAAPVVWAAWLWMR